MYVRYRTYLKIGSIDLSRTFGKWPRPTVNIVANSTHYDYKARVRYVVL